MPIDIRDLDEDVVDYPGVTRNVHAEYDGVRREYYDILSGYEYAPVNSSNFINRYGMTGHGKAQCPPLPAEPLFLRKVSNACWEHRRNRH